MEPQCFVDLPEGDYTISVAVPEGYNPTTENSYELALKAGDKTYLNFGAQENSMTEEQAPIIPPPGSDRSPLLGIVGALFLLAGVGGGDFCTKNVEAQVILRLSKHHSTEIEDHLEWSRCKKRFTSIITRW